MICNEVSSSGLPIPLNTGPVVETIDLSNPDKTKTCITSAIGYHLLPRNILTKSCERINISPVNGADKLAATIRAFLYATLNREISFCILEKKGNVILDITWVISVAGKLDRIKAIW